MGQAKQRGSFEQRKQESIQKKLDKIAEDKRAAEEWWESLTEEQKEEELRKFRDRRRSRQKAMEWIGMAIGLGNI